MLLIFLAMGGTSVVIAAQTAHLCLPKRATRMLRSSAPDVIRILRGGVTYPPARTTDEVRSGPLPVDPRDLAPHRRDWPVAKSFLQPHRLRV